MQEDKRIPLHIQSITQGSKQRRTFFFPKLGKHHDSQHIFLWVLATIIIGVSVPYFLLDVGSRVVAKIKGEAPIVEPVAVVETRTPEEQKKHEEENPMGSDEAPLATELSSNQDAGGTYYFLTPKYILPKTNGLAYRAFDVETGEVIIEKNPDKVFPIASISKLTTALVAKEVLDLHQLVSVSRSSTETYGVAGGLFAGEKILVTDLLYPLLIESSNDAAEVLAEGYGREAFLKKMNEFVKGLGMTSTFYHDPSGLSHKNVSTAADLSLLLRYIYKEKPEILDITRVREFGILKHRWVNGNRLMQKASFVGGKNGYTEEALRTTASIFELKVDGKKRRVGIVVLKSVDKDSDTDRIIRFIETTVGFAPKDSPLLQDN